MEPPEVILLGFIIPHTPCCITRLNIGGKLRRQCLGIFVFYSSILDMGYTGQLECNRVDLARHAADHPGVWATPRTILK